MRRSMQVFAAGILAITLLLVSGAFAQETAKTSSNTYLVVASEGPGFTSPQEAIQILEKGILPSFHAIMKLQQEKKVIAGGLPVGERAFVFIMQASSNAEVDQVLRSLPAWGALKWKVTALESFAGRATQERQILDELKKTSMK